MTPTIKEDALGYVPQLTIRYVSELPIVSTDIVIQEATGMNKKEGKEFTYKYIDINGERYRVPNIVRRDLKVILEANPNLKQFKVIKSGMGRDTRYTTIPVN